MKEISSGNGIAEKYKESLCINFQLDWDYKRIGF